MFVSVNPNPDEIGAGNKIENFITKENDTITVNCSFVRLDQCLLPKLKQDFNYVKDHWGEKFARKLFYDVYFEIRKNFLRIENSEIGRNAIEELNQLISMCSEYVDEGPIKYVTLEGYIEV